MTLQVVKPFWTVVVPLYNKQEFIETALRSVLDQAADEDLEVVVVDDGSRDEGAARVLKLSDPRVRLIRQRNAGVAAARNRGIREARGQWIAFLDADDIWRPNALRVYREIQQRYPEILAVAGGYARVQSSELANFPSSNNNKDGAIRIIDNLPAELLEIGMPFCTDTIAINRSVFDRFEVWFPEGESMGEDLDLWLRVVENFGLGYSSSCIALYRVDLASSLMGSRVFSDLFPFILRLEHRAKHQIKSSAVSKASLDWVADARVSLAREQVKAGNRARAASLLGQASRRLISARWWFTWLAILFPAVLNLRK